MRKTLQSPQAKITPYPVLILVMTRIIHHDAQRPFVKQKDATSTVSIPVKACIDFRKPFYQPIF